ncbi:hypothetical protein [Parabacteroides distasonis]|uniref:hypothetical protein n=1 Tax=Parabacteroides distasonis TaxID=823 RepID=UPI003F1F649D
MRQVVYIILLAVLAISGTHAQVYDGITQPTRYRLFMPVSVSLKDKGINVTSFVGFRADVAEWLSLTPVLQYNRVAEAVAVGAWVNVNYQKRFYLLSRNMYDIKTGLFTETLSATVKLPHGFMIDSTWDNLYNGRAFLDGDRLQVVGGWDYRRIVVNAGYSLRAWSGFIANLRFKVTQYNWLQLKYDQGQNMVSVAMALQFN